MTPVLEAMFRDAEAIRARYEAAELLPPRPRAKAPARTPVGQCQREVLGIIRGMGGTATVNDVAAAWRPGSDREKVREQLKRMVNAGLLRFEPRFNGGKPIAGIYRIRGKA